MSGHARRRRSSTRWQDRVVLQDADQRGHMQLRMHAKARSSGDGSATQDNQV